MNYCCDVFERFLQDAGSEGISVAVGDFGRPRCFLQARRCAGGHPDQWMTSICVSYCPACGESLDYVLEREDIANLVARHRVHWVPVQGSE